MNTLNKTLLLMTSLLTISACELISNSISLTSSAAQGDATNDELNQLKPLITDQDTSNWQYVAELSDEFNHSAVDESVWETDLQDWGPWSWETDNVKVDDGKLHISMTYEPHQTVRRAWNNGGKPVDVELFYKSGIIRSAQHQTYGYYEARMKGIPTFPGSSPAFWIYSLNDEVARMGLKGKKEGEVTYSEVDIVELQQAEWDPNMPLGYDGANVIDMNLHTRIIENGKEVWKRPGKFPELTRNKIHADFDARDDFHVYGAEVTPETVTWFIDGKQVAQKPNLYWHLPMRVTLSLGLRYPHVSYNKCTQGLDRCTVPSAATAEGYPSAMQVDWVRVYKPKQN